MSVTLEHVWNGHNNPITRQLLESGVAKSLSAVTAMTATIGAKTVSSTNQADDPILWAQAGYATGEYRLYLGLEGFTASAQRQQVYVVVYAADYPEGIVWDSFPVIVHDEVEVS